MFFNNVLYVVSDKVTYWAVRGQLKIHITFTGASVTSKMKLCDEVLVWVAFSISDSHSSLLSLPPVNQLSIFSQINWLSNCLQIHFSTSNTDFMQSWANSILTPEYEYEYIRSKNKKLNTPDDHVFTSMSMSSPHIPPCTPPPLYMDTSYTDASKVLQNISNFLGVMIRKHRKNCECCHHHSLLKGHNVNVKIVVPNCQKCYQCLKC